MAARLGALIPKATDQPRVATRVSRVSALQARRQAALANLLRTNVSGVACQRDGTTSLPRAWDHLEVLLSIVNLRGGVNAGALALAV